MVNVDTRGYERLRESGLVTSMDLHFARLMDELGKGADGLFLAAGLASGQTRFGHVCLDLGQVAGKSLDGEGGMVCPDLAAWTASLRQSPVVGHPGDYCPLILDDRSRLYLYRYWNYQRLLSEHIVDRALWGQEPLVENPDLVKERLDRLFSADDRDQKVAACVAMLQTFSVISGGPGTGKTTTVARLLVLLIETFLDSRPERPMTIRLAAPTGKAAARLKESMVKALSGIDIDDAVRSCFPEEVFTLHRLLGYIPHSPYFRYNEERKLIADVVIVDEASMVDLALMSKLVSALEDHTRLILIGDQDQLASVEAGAVLGDICNTGSAKQYAKRFGSVLSSLTGADCETKETDPTHTGIENCIAVLKKSYRFLDTSGIGALSRLANEGDAKGVKTLCDRREYSDVEAMGLPHPPDLLPALRNYVLEGFGAYLSRIKEGPDFKALDRFRVLCAVRKGPYGVEAMNRCVEAILSEEGLIDPVRPWYVGRPVMITRNDYRLGLFNGDVGIVCEGALGAGLQVAFPDGFGGTRSFRPEKLPEHETVFAMTVHKSQGSEFDHVLFVFPEKESPVLSRELVYTGITRAKKRVSLMADERILSQAIRQRTRRNSGLRDRLWGTIAT